MSGLAEEQNAGEGKGKGKGRGQARPRAPRVTVQVTKEIIEAAEKRDSSHCMIAEAVKSAVPGATGVSVDLQTIRFTDPNRNLRYVYLTPRPAQVALVSFDQGIHTAPFSMVLRAAQVVRAGAGNRGATKGKTPPMPEGTKKELVTRGSVSRVPAVVGGAAPPLADLSNSPYATRPDGKPRAGELSNTSYRGKRREFGLRGLRV